ncbi:MAG: efflux RND transporter permease subunit [Desulfarculaceae bacterium]|nr:efflux RND transporter permease subunit [Desulfarculaceae bacterium]MCF8046816.1 efflux RND transporter permease subunit [Desulfarculaceae bacterium]MCF8065093.1 efflux RND transporter permease subunit [Desulfarculaceae bacterium]MCF8097450.1 efflux RND transporter permease subunit [Desulfarculaceae bacterium]MCF8121405.1 efflux RND transporter permease subunit [Desulfarculaceae bacterium]
MFLTDFSIRRPVAATMMVTALVVFGLIGMTRLGVSLYPDVDFPMVTVTTVWENARPEEVDNEITDKLEDAISSVSGIKHINSASMQGVSRIIVEFELSKDVDVAAQELRDKISTKLRELPTEAESPVIDKLDINAQPIIWLAVRGPQAIETLTKVADEQLRPMIQKIQGVGEVRVGGAREKEVHVWLDRERLAAYKLGVNDVIAALAREHVEIPGGKIESKEKEFLIRTVGEFPTPEAFNRMIVAFKGGYPVRLEDVGVARSARQESVGVARFTTKDTGGMRTVGLGISPRSGANEVAIAQKVRQVLPELRRVAPEGIIIDVATDTTIFTEKSISEVQFQLLLGAIIAALIIFLFLQNLRTTIISAVAIPTSIISTFACMYWMGFTMNNMSMLALVTAVGLVIDDAIVMVENIFRHRTELKQGAMEAAFEGSSEIAFAVVATTVALGGVFLPVAFMGGIVGRFFYEFAVTLAFSVACSTFVALTVVPMLSARFLTVKETTNGLFNLFNSAMEGTSRFYRRLIAWCLRHRLSVMAAAMAALVVGGWVFTMLGKEFVTAEDEGRFMVRLEMPLSYSLEKTDSVLQRLEKQMIKVPEISHFFSVSGWDGSNKAVAMVTLTPKAERKRGQTELQVVVRGLLRQLPDVRGTVSRISPLGAGSRNEDIQFVIQGPEIDKIDKYSQELMERLEKTPGYVGITRNLEIGKPEVRVKIDRARAADAGVSVREVANAVAALLGGVKTVDFREGGKSYDVRVRLMEDQRVLPQDAQRIWLRANDGRLLDVASFVTLEQGVGPNIINRLDRGRSATVYANLEGKLLGEAMPEVQAIADGMLPDGYTTSFVGRAEAFAETTGFIAFAFLLAIALTYMVLAAQFESFAHPLAIMMGLPLSFIGAFGLLFLMGNSFNLFSMIALILLVGLATKNGILLIDYTRQLREKGMGAHEALIEAGATRLRPILMTAVSTIGGVLPVVLALGVGSESRQPMAVAIAGGMVSSTVLTLLVVPVVYSYLDQFTNWKLVRWIQHRFMAPDAIKDGQKK